MIYRYDLHIHSGLSPCGDKEMSPANIIAACSALGLDIISLTDHNAIDNVENVMKYGKMLDVLVVPGIEVSTNEDIHILCYFPTFEKLKEFFSKLEYPNIKNKKWIFGRQYIYDENDEIVDEVERTLIAGCNYSENTIFELAKEYQGIAVPAHIDRAGSGMLLTLGTVPEYYPTIEISRSANLDDYAEYVKKHNVIRNSDSHCLDMIGLMKGKIELDSLSVEAVIETLSK